MTKARTIAALLIVAAVILYIGLDLGRFLTLESIQSRLGIIQQYTDEHFVVAALAYFLIYLLVAALALPAATLVTLAGGAVFGLFWGAILVSFASTIGGTIAFLFSRLLLRDWVQHRFRRYLGPINRGMEKDGNFFLFSLRMVPLFPFFVVNLLMGITPISVRSFYLISQLGMLPATLVYVNAGSELGQITSLNGLVSGSVLFSIALLGLLPLAGRLLVEALRRGRVLRRYETPAEFDANVVVIGAGSAGLVASLIAAGAKARVILIEKHKMGGDCLNTGCVPSKSLIRSGRVAATIREAGRFGIQTGAAVTDFPAVMDRIREVIRRIEPHDSVERYTSLGVECIGGEAKIISPYAVTVNGRTITTRSIIIATGASPFVPPIPGLDEIAYLTSDTVWSMLELPSRLLVVGGGPIGCELAQAFNNLGADVTLVDQAEQLLPREDEDVAAAVVERFTHEGIRVLTGHRVVRFIGNPDSDILHGGVMEAEHKGETLRIAFDRVLIAVGRKPNVTGFGLEELDMPLTEQGAVLVDESMQTAFPNIFACGDVAGPYQFTHMASFQAWYASLNALIGWLKKSRADYRVVPAATFIDPEVARVGLNEREAVESETGYEVTRFGIDDLDRAIADGEAHGFIKVLTVPGKDRILGATIVGEHAGELIGEFVLAMTHKLGLKKIAATTHIYPTMLEANRFVANAWRSQRLPKKWFPLLEKYFRWHRKVKREQEDS
ncbi:MAG: FAD-dependent oxidoreductase [Pseudohongiellaceae bacterium]